MSAGEFEGLLASGLAAHQAGRIEDALTAYRAAISLQPEDAEVASLLGVALSQSAWADQAAGFLARAVQLEPEQIPFRMNFVEGLERLGQIERARQEVRAVIVRDPGHVRGWEKAGDLAAQAGDFDAAQAAWTQARMLAPHEPTPALKLAALEGRRRRPERAHAILDALAARIPEDSRLLSLRCNILAGERNWPAFAATTDIWLRAHPDDADAWRSLSRSHFEAGRYRDAANTFGRVLTLVPANAADLTSFAQLCLHALDIDAATGALAQAEQLEPEYPDMLAARALLSMYMGRFVETETDCVRCLAVDTSNASAAVTLSRVRRGRLADSELAIMRRVADDPNADLDRRIPAAFTIAHALDSRRDYDVAFAAYQTAHALAQQRDNLESRRFDAGNLASRRERILALDFSKMAPVGNTARAPRAIFIVGMPRSGTTLVEAVIAAHPRVLGCGERITLPPLLDALVTISSEGRTIDGELLDEARRNYLAGLPNPGKADCFTDKQPFNFQAIGLIDKMLPDAAVVYVRRNPIETCLSIYRQEFNKAWSFAHSLDDIAAVYAHHALLMHEWQARLPARFTTIQYEDLVADFDASARALIAACGLEWDPACHEFQRAARPIATFSAVEVRGKVSSHNGRAANYQRHLAPLIAALTHYRVDLVSGAVATAP